MSPGPLRFELTQTHSDQIQGQLTRVPVRRKEARDLLETRHQEILGEQMEGRLQGWVWLQGVLQATVLHQHHVLALWGRGSRQGLKARAFPIKELKPRNDNKCHEQTACFQRMTSDCRTHLSSHWGTTCRRNAHSRLGLATHSTPCLEFQARPGYTQHALSQVPG